jgi:hypothetical protein
METHFRDEYEECRAARDLVSRNTVKGTKGIGL